MLTSWEDVRSICMGPLGRPKIHFLYRGLRALNEYDLSLVDISSDLHRCGL